MILSKDIIYFLFYLVEVKDQICVYNESSKSIQRVTLFGGTYSRFIIHVKEEVRSHTTIFVK